jgi:hypothetical protein
MSGYKVAFPGFRVEVGSGWKDLTEADKNEPFTLGKEKDPVGALQFSIALYQGGRYHLLHSRIYRN